MVGMLPVTSRCAVYRALEAAGIPTGKGQAHKSMVVESRAYTGLGNKSTPKILHEFRSRAGQFRLGEIGIDTPVAMLVGGGQRVDEKLPAEASSRVGLLGTKARLRYRGLRER